MTNIDYAIASQEAAPVVAARLGVSERTVHRYRRRRTKTTNADIQAAIEKRLRRARQVVAAHKGNKDAIRDTLLRAGINRCMIYQDRRTLLRTGAITTDDWPSGREEVSLNNTKLLRSMVLAGATVTQVARCFDLTNDAAVNAIRATWSLIRLEREK